MALATRRTRLLAAAPLIFSAGCFSSEDGVEPPLDRLYFPVGLAIDTAAAHLFVVNSNFDLQFNGGALQSYDLVALRDLAPKPCTSNGDCEKFGRICDLAVTTENRGDPSGWCVPADDLRPCGPFGEKSVADKLLAPGRCQAADPNAPPVGAPLIVDTVGIGAFATDVLYRPNPDATLGGRLFIPARGDTTLHWVDVDPGGRLECGQAGNDGDCDDRHRRGDDAAEESTRNIRLPPEPFGIDATEDGTAIAVSHQTEGTVSLFVNDWGSQGPLFEFPLAGLPARPIGIAAVPVPAAAGPGYLPGFLVSFRDAAEVHLVRFFSDVNAHPARPFIERAGSSGIRTNSVGFDSRGLAIDGSERKACEVGCQEPDPDAQQECLETCAGIALRVFVANRTPSSLVVGRTPPAAAIGNDLPRFIDTIDMPFGPSRVVVGHVLDRNGAKALRVFVVCFDSRTIAIYDPDAGQKETEITTGRGPHSFAVDVIDGDAPHAFGYIGHFTDSYLGVVDLDQRHATYGQIVLSVGVPTPPRASK
jgi:hypothetical protein